MHDVCLLGTFYLSYLQYLLPVCHSLCLLLCWDKQTSLLEGQIKLILFFSLRLSKLLLRLPALRLISAAVTEELFFAGLIGNVQIDSIIPYILKMESTDYNSQAVSGV